VANFPPLSTTLAKLGAKFATSIVGTGRNFAAGVVETGGKFGQCRWYRWCTLTSEYLREFSKKFETVLMGYSGAGGKLTHEKNQKQKILWHFPFNEPPQSKMKMRVESFESSVMFSWNKRFRGLLTCAQQYGTGHFYDSFRQLLVGYLGKQKRQGQGRPLPQPTNLTRGTSYFSCAAKVIAQVLTYLYRFIRLRRVEAYLLHCKLKFIGGHLLGSARSIFIERGLPAEQDIGERETKGDTV
jgi:hypothetical protein